jgi:SAM-dependent methyltransferase
VSDEFIRAAMSSPLNRTEDRHHHVARLFTNVQFIYELILAQLELRSLQASFEMTDELWSFKLLDNDSDDRLRKRVAYFQTIGGVNTDYFYISQQNQTRSVNQYLTHWIYPYKGKFHPQMIRAALNIIGLEAGETVLDPFIGSGTTALEAQLLGVNCVGFDTSPLCVLQSSVKTSSLEVAEEITARCEELNGLAQTQRWEEVVRPAASTADRKVEDFFLLAKLVALSDSVRRRKDLQSALEFNTKMMAQSIISYRQIARELNLPLGRTKIERGDARKLPLRDNSIDGIITSPPYAIALDYVKNDAHALGALGLDVRELREQFIGLRGPVNARVQLYNEDLRRSVEEMARVLKPHRFALIVIGNAAFNGNTLNTVELVTQYADEIGLRLMRSVDKTIFGLYNVMQKEKVLILKKDEASV